MSESKLKNKINKLLSPAGKWFEDTFGLVTTTRRALMREGNIKDIDAMDAEHFAEFCPKLFKCLCYKILEPAEGVIKHEKTPDGDEILKENEQASELPVDFILNGIIGVKCRLEKFEMADTKAAFGEVGKNGITQLMLVTNGGFTDEVFQYAKDKPIELIGRKRLTELINCANNQYI